MCNERLYGRVGQLEFRLVGSIVPNCIGDVLGSYEEAIIARHEYQKSNPLAQVLIQRRVVTNWEVLDVPPGPSGY